MYSFSYIIRIKPSILSNHLSSGSKFPKNHYDVLNLPRTCTSKQIKESFIRLSKEYHPDLNKNKDAHKNFLAINESYKVLSNAESRRNYDLGLIRPHNNNSDPQVYTRHHGTNAWNDPTFYSNRDRNRDKFYKGKSYYGIKGQERVSNIKVVSVCICLTIVIVSLQFLAITKSVTFQRDDLLKKSEEAQDSLKLLKKPLKKMVTKFN